MLLFGAGFGVGVWTQRHRCKVPPPPPSLLGELSPKPAQPAGASSTDSGTNPSYLAQEIERIRPEIDAFRNRIDEIDREMDQRIDAILRPEQRTAFQELVKRGEEYRARQEAERGISTPLTAEQIHDLQQQPLQRLFSIIVIPLRVYWNKRQLQLDDAQTAQLTEILKWRRDRFLELIDQSPPPSLQLSALAPLAARLGEPERHDAEKNSPPPPSNQP